MSNPFFSIITPTLQRDSLIHCCESIDEQTFTDWQHIVMVDSDNANYEMWDTISLPNREIYWCVNPHKNYGNTCRHNGWDFAVGQQIIYLDDDNFLMDRNILRDLEEVLKDISNAWAIFPIMRHGRRFFYDPPGCCYVDTANMIIRREFAQWPDGPEYTMDGIFCDRLKLEHPSYAAFPDFRPIINMPASNEGK